MKCIKLIEDPNFLWPLTKEQTVPGIGPRGWLVIEVLDQDKWADAGRFFPSFSAIFNSKMQNFPFFRAFKYEMKGKNRTVIGRITVNLDKIANDEEVGCSFSAFHPQISLDLSNQMGGYITKCIQLKGGGTRLERTATGPSGTSRCGCCSARTPGCRPPETPFCW